MTRCTAMTAGLAPGLPALAHAGAEAGWEHHGMMGWGGGMGWFMGPIFMLLVVLAGVALVVLLVRWLGGSDAPSAPGSGPDSGSSPVRILEERFARGEIDEEEFRQRKRALGQ